MAIRSIAHLKSFFKSVPVNDRPGATEFGDFFDTLSSYEDMAYAALAASAPVILVADEAARLALGPSVYSGQRVKESDNGVTYSKQHGPGSNVDDWEPFGDTAIVITDVVNLPATLATKLVKDDDDASNSRLGMRNNRLDPLGAWAVGSSPNRIFVDLISHGLNYSEAPGNFTLALVTPPFSMHGRSVTGLIYNPQVGSVTVSLGVGMIGTNSEWPLTLGAGKYIYITVTGIRFPGDSVDTILVAAIPGT